MTENSRHHTYMIPGLERGLAVLELLATKGPLSLSEIASEMDVRRSSAYRVVYTLEHLGFAQRDEHRRYGLAPRVLKLGFSFLRSLDIVDVAKPFLERLRDQTKASSHLAIRDGKEVVDLSRYVSTGGIMTHLGTGDRAPAHSTVMGQVLLAAMPDQDVYELFGADALPTITEKTPASTDELIDILHMVREKGFAIGYSNLHKGIAAIAAPVRDGHNDTVAAISITTLEAAIDLAEFESSTCLAVVETAATISRELGWSKP